jgi:proline dehydrogenase
MLALAAAAAVRRLRGPALRRAASAAVPEAAPPPLEPLPPKPLPTPPAPADALGELPVGPAAPALDFTDTAVAFRSKTTSELVRTLCVFAACRQRWLVNNADALLAASRRALGARAANALVRASFYAQFVGGADAPGLEPTLRRLRAAGVGAVLDYAAEDDVAAPAGPRSRRGAQASVVARTFEYEDERACDCRMGSFLDAIDAAAGAGTGAGQGFAAIKLTALGPPRLLERASRALLAIRNLFRRLDADGDGTLTAEEFSAGFRRLFSEGDPGADARLFDALDADHDGAVDYVAFTKGVTVAEGAAAAARCRAAGPFAAAALSAEELRLLARMVARASALAAAAAERGVKLMIDAEHSYYQPAVDAVALELQREHNATEARVFNTYQCYTTDVHDRLVRWVCITDWIDRELINLINLITVAFSLPPRRRSTSSARGASATTLAPKSCAAPTWFWSASAPPSSGFPRPSGTRRSRRTPRTTSPSPRCCPGCATRARR